MRIAAVATIVLLAALAPAAAAATGGAAKWLPLEDGNRWALAAARAGALDRAIWFSPGYGIVRIEGPAGEDFLLAEAEVGSDRYPSWRERTPAPPPDPGAALLLTVADVEQVTDYSCGPAALEAVLAHYGVPVEQRRL